MRLALFTSVGGLNVKKISSYQRQPLGQDRSIQQTDTYGCLGCPLKVLTVC